MPTKLTDKQQKFVDNYVINGRKSVKAAKDAGYSCYLSEGSYLLTLPHIQKALDKKIVKLTRADEFKGMLTFDAKRRKLQYLIEKCIDEEGNIDIKAAELALKAMVIDNDMTGDKAAEKRVNANFDVRTDADIKQAAEVMQSLMKKYESDH